MQWQDCAGMWSSMVTNQCYLWNQTFDLKYLKLLTPSKTSIQVKLWISPVRRGIQGHFESQRWLVCYIQPWEFIRVCSLTDEGRKFHSQGLWPLLACWYVSGHWLAKTCRSESLRLLTMSPSWHETHGSIEGHSWISDLFVISSSVSL